MVENITEEIKDNSKITANTPEKRNIERTLKIFAVVIGIFLMCCIVLIKIVNPGFSIWWVIMLFAFVLLVCGIMFFWFAIFRKKEENTEYFQKGKLPQPLSLDSLRRIAQAALTNEYYANHLRVCESEKFYHIGKTNKSRVYIYKAKALYADNMEKGNIYVIINAHYAEELKTILIDPNAYELSHAIKMIAGEQDEEPDVEENYIYNPMTGVYSERKKVSKHKEEPRKEEKKGDLE